MTPPASTTDPAAFRRLFPSLAHAVHLASCSLGARSTQLDQALTAMLAAMARHGAPWPRFEEQYAQARERFAALVGAQTEQVAVVPSASVGAFQVASTLSWRRRPRLVSATAEFPGVARAWLSQRACGAEVVFVGERTGRVSAADYLSAIDERTKLVSIPMTTYRDGVRLPVAALAAAAHNAGALVFVDAYQAAGVEPVDVARLDCDYLVTGMAKYLCGLPGVAFTYAREPAAGDRPPHLTTWLAQSDPFRFDPSYVGPVDARRFELGTHAVPALYAANAGLALVGGLDLQVVRDYVSELVGYAVDRLSEMGERLPVCADRAARGAHVSVVDPDPAGLARWLAQRRIAVSPRGDVVRVSLHFYNNRRDVDAVCEQLYRYRVQTVTTQPGAVLGDRRA